MAPEEIDNRFVYHPPTDDKTRETHEFVRTTFRLAAETINNILPEGREKAIAMTKLEEGMFWANAAIART